MLYIFYNFQPFHLRLHRRHSCGLEIWLEFKYDREIKPVGTYKIVKVLLTLSQIKVSSHKHCETKSWQFHTWYLCYYQFFRLNETISCILGPVRCSQCFYCRMSVASSGVLRLNSIGTWFPFGLQIDSIFFTLSLKFCQSKFFILLLSFLVNSRTVKVSDFH